jgi:hypothetical protein
MGALVTGAGRDKNRERQVFQGLLFWHIKDGQPRAGVASQMQFVKGQDSQSFIDKP